MPPVNSSLIKLNNDYFWEWMSHSNSASEAGIKQYINLIAKRIFDASSIVGQCHDENHSQASSTTLESLSRCMPREYFLEIQFCAFTYATFFGKVFPPLAQNVEELAYIEWLLYVEPGFPRYRDHLVHMFKVAFAGDQLLANESFLTQVAECQFASAHFTSWCQKRNLLDKTWFNDKKEARLNEKKELVKIAFFLAALFHDFGYGYNYLRLYKERLFKLYRWLTTAGDPVDIHAQETRKFLQSLPASFVRTYHGWLNSQKNRHFHSDNAVAGFLRDCLPLNHSTASTLFILDLAERLWDTGVLSQEMYIAFQIAAEACLIHDMTGEKSWMHLKSDKNDHDHFLHCEDHKKVPIAALLVLADELSFWRRYRLEPQVEDERVIYSLSKESVTEEIRITVSTEAEKVIKIEAPPNSKLLKETLDEKLAMFHKGLKDDDPYLLDYRIDVL